MPVASSRSTILHDTAGRLQRGTAALARRLRASTPAATSGDGLSPARLGILAGLRRSGVGMTASALAADLGIQPQSLTRLLADLEDRRLIARRTDSTDRRRSLIALTPAGTALLATELQRRRAALAATIAATFTPAEQKQLHQATLLLDRLAAALPRVADEPGGDDTE